MTVGQLILVVIVVVLVLRFRQPSAEPLTAHRALRWALGLWAVAFPIVSCSPLFVGASSSSGGTAAGGFVSLVVGATLFAPWIVGLLVLGVLVWVTT